MANPYKFCPVEPYLLDTQEKVDWANKIMLDDWARIGYKLEAGEALPWKLGDHCYYKPLQA